MIQAKGNFSNSDYSKETIQVAAFLLRLCHLCYSVYFYYITFILEHDRFVSTGISGLRLQYIMGMLFLIGHIKMFAQVYMWAQETVTKEQMVTCNKLLMAAFTLFLTLALVVAWNIYCSRPILATFLLVWLSIYNILPLYMLLRRKLVPRRWLLFATLIFFVCFLILMWFLSQSHFELGCWIHPETSVLSEFI